MGGIPTPPLPLQEPTENTGGEAYGPGGLLAGR